MNCTAILKENLPLWGEWELQEAIGSGAQSQVFLVTNDRGERRALKVMPMDAEQSAEEVREQLELTERMGSAEGLMPCLGSGEITGAGGKAAVILMPMLNPLNDIMMERELTAAEIINLGRDLCRALEQCRLNGIIHRDIKPANVFADENGRFFLGDLGVARNLEHTMLATRKGTMAYMSPEIASGRPCSHLSDVYSLGIMLYQLLNGGRLPLLSSDARFSEIEEAVNRRQNGEPLPLPENARNRLGQLVCDMCAYERRKRPDASRCLRELDYIASLVSEDKPIPPPALRVSRKIIIPAAVAAAVLLLLLLMLPALKNNSVAYPSASVPAANAFASGGTAGDGEWLYFGSDADGLSGYRVNVRDGRRENIYDGSITHINLCDDRLYFSANHTLESVERLEDGGLLVSMRSGVRSMSADGTDEQILCSCDTLNAVEYDGWVYHYVAELNLGVLSSDLDGDDRPTFTRVMRVKTDGTAEEELCVLENIHASGMYVYRGRIYLICADYTQPDERQSYVLSLSLDGSEHFRVVDQDVSSVDFHGDYILYTTDRLYASDLMRKPVDGSRAAEKIDGIRAERFCVYGDSVIYDSDGLYIRSLSGGEPRLLSDEESVSRMQFAGDMLVACTYDGRSMLVDIASGEVTELSDFRFELY